MNVFLTLLGVAAISWTFRIMFTALVPAERLPAVVRSRMDAVGPAVFAALLATELAGTSHVAMPTTIVSLGAAAVAARLTGNHLAAIGAAAAAWMVMSLW